MGCDTVVGKRKATCDQKVCARCALHVGPDRDLCRTHALLVKKCRIAHVLLADPDPNAMMVVADLVEQLAEQPAPVRDWVARIHRAGATVLPERDLAFVPRDMEDWNEYFIERAAIAEYVHGHSRDIANAIARERAGPPPLGPQSRQRELAF